MRSGYIAGTAINVDGERSPRGVMIRVRALGAMSDMSPGSGGGFNG